jgi:hypothetical protein
MTEFLMIVLYLAAFGASSAMFTVEQWKDSPGPLFASLLWPIIMPILIMRWLVIRGRERVGQIRKSSDPNVRAIEYAQAPMSIMLAMIGQRMLANPENINEYENYWRDSSRKIKVSFSTHARKMMYVDIGGKTLYNKDFDPKEVEKFNEIISTTVRFYEEAQLAKKKSDHNMLALDVIEKILAEDPLTPVPPSDHPNAPYTKSKKNRHGNTIVTKSAATSSNYDSFKLYY